jgi:hypothetical protein
MLLVVPVTAVAACLVAVARVEAKWGAQVERREAVREAFLYNYREYEEHAYPHDVLQPITKSGADNEILAG